MPKTALMLSFLFDLSYIAKIKFLELFFDLSYIAKIKFLELSISDNFVILDCITVIQFDTQTCQPTT